MTNDTDPNETDATIDASTIDRRALLGALGLGAAGVTAGCLGGGDDGDEPGGATPTSEPTAEPTATPTPTPTATATPGGDVAGLGPCAVERTDPPDDAVEVGGIVTEDTTYGADADHYLVTETLEVRGDATLTIEPGTTLTFGHQAGLQIQEEASLSAVGTCGEPILMTGKQHQAGYCEGLYFNNGAPVRSELSYVVVEDGGWDEDPDDAGVLLDGMSIVSVEHSLLRANEGEGVRVRYPANLDSFEHNVVTENTRGAAWVPASRAHQLSANNDFTGNEKDRVVVFTSTARDEGGLIHADADVTWQDLGVSYETVGDDWVNGTLRVEGALTFDPGATVEFHREGFVEVAGALTLAGTEDEPVTFTGTEQGAGHWFGVRYEDSDAAANRIEHAVIEYAGRDDVTALYVDNGSRLAVTDCTVRNNQANGVFLNAMVTVDEFANNTITGNGRYPVYARANQVHNLDATTSYTGNEQDAVLVFTSTARDEGGTIPVDYDVSWKKLDVNYETVGDDWVNGELRVEGALTVEPGVTVEFHQEGHVEVPGALTLDGTEDEPVTFTGKQKGPGYWGNLYYTGSADPRNVIRHAVVEYAGKFAENGDNLHIDEPANVVLTDGAKLTIEDSTIRHSDAWAVAYEYPDSGLREDERCDLTTSNVTYEDNASGNVHRDT